jgi:ribonucleoside-diphosphate reductase beta chain
MSLLDTRNYFKPFEYPEFYEIWTRAQAAHWSPFEVQLSSDVDDWKLKLTDSERNVVGNILKSFTTVETHVEDYWASKVGRFFKKIEIQMVAHTFAAFETIHSVGYSYLNDSLGLDDYKAFLNDPASYAKIERMMSTKGKTKSEIAKSLAIFSAFIEGVSLFSSFAVLLSFSKRNLLKNVGQIIAWSVLDEQLHSSTGILLYNIMRKEYPEIITDDFKKDIYEAARLTIKQEDDFIDKVFELGDIEGITSSDLKAFMRYRANDRLKAMGLKANWNNIDRSALDRMNWFSVIVNGQGQADFFAVKETSYSKNVLDFSTVWE